MLIGTRRLFHIDLHIHICNFLFSLFPEFLVKQDVGFFNLKLIPIVIILLNLWDLLLPFIALGHFNFLILN